MTEVIRISDQTDLVPTSKYPHAYWPFSHFNPVQSRLFDYYEGTSNVAVAAATAAGKTVCSELYAAYEVRVRKGKCIYIGPMKALAKEKEMDWTDPKHHFHDLKVAICTGDYRFNASKIKELDNADIIVMTPEMLASRCRNSKSERSSFLKDVGTIIFDESHLLTVPSRGDHIEIALMKMTEINPNVRVVLLSATMPNVDEICQWVSKLTNRDTYFLESTYRPCPLGIHYEKYFDGDKKYEDKELEKVATAVGVVNYYSDDKFLVFVHTKKTGQLMVDALKKYGIHSEFHSADLNLEKRLSLEQKFKEGDLRVVIATSTLAWGCYAHGSRLLGPKARLINVEDVNVGDNLLCPVGDTFEERQVIRVEDFKAESGYFVQLESGEEMTVSNDHLFYAANNRNSPEWVPVKNLLHGDFVATPSDLNIYNRSPVKHNNFWYLCGFAFGDGSITKCGKYLDESIKSVLFLCLGKNDKHESVIVNMFNEEFKTDLYPFLDSNNVSYIRTKKRKIVDRFLTILPLGRKNGNDDLSPSIYGHKTRIVNFLRGWFDADGGLENHSNGNSSVGLSCISKTAIESARMLLLAFGIRTSFGKKKMKSTIINGRFQAARRNWSYRLRIFGYENIFKFKEVIGFLHQDKQKRLETYLTTINKTKPTKDLIPARNLISEHLTANEISSTSLKQKFRIDLWNSVNKQDCTRKTINGLLEITQNKTALNDLAQKPYYWSRIKEIKKCNGGVFREIEIEDPHAYVGNGVISHNCNLPSRRVVIVGVDRGLTPVENYDIWQMAGRAGRPAYDPRGDVYILVPESREKEIIARIKKKSPIKSQLLEDFAGHHKTLAFHLVSEIHHGYIKTKKEFYHWFSRSLAHHQNHDFNDETIDKVIDLLVKHKAVEKNGDEYKVTSIGTVASMFYFSPFDVADLRSNFKNLFEKGLKNDDLALSVALGNLDSHRFNIVNKNEKAEMADFQRKVELAIGKGTITDSCMKAAHGYHNMLNGVENATFSSFQSGLRLDADRTLEVLGAIDSMSGKWGESDFMKTMKLRLTYGVGAHLVELCQIPNIGRVRAEKLYKAKVRTLDDFVKLDENTLSVMMNLNLAKTLESLKEARTIRLRNFV